MTSAKVVFKLCLVVCHLSPGLSFQPEFVRSFLDRPYMLTNQSLNDPQTGTWQKCLVKLNKDEAKTMFHDFFFSKIVRLEFSLHCTLTVLKLRQISLTNRFFRAIFRKKTKQLSSKSSFSLMIKSLCMNFTKHKLLIKV